MNGDICDHIHNHGHNSHEDRLVHDDDKQVHDDKALDDKVHDDMAQGDKVHDGMAQGDMALGDMDHDDKGLRGGQLGDEEVLEQDHGDHVVQTRESLVHGPPQKIQDLAWLMLRGAGLRQPENIFCKNFVFLKLKMII